MGPQINVSPPTARPQAHSFSNSAPSLPQGLAELDAETPGRYRPHGNEKYSYSPQRGERRGRASCSLPHTAPSFLPSTSPLLCFYAGLAILCATLTCTSL